MVELYGGVLRGGTVYVGIPSSIRVETVYFELELAAGRRLLIDKQLVRESESAAQYFPLAVDTLLSNSFLVSFELPEFSGPLCRVNVLRESFEGEPTELRAVEGYSLMSLYPTDKVDRERTFTSSACRHRDISTLMFILEQQHKFPAGEMGYVNNARVVYSYRALETGSYELLIKSLSFIESGLQEAQKFPDINHVRNGKTFSILSLNMVKLHVLIFLGDFSAARQVASSIKDYMSRIETYRTSYAYNHVKILLIDMFLSLMEGPDEGSALDSVEKIKSAFALAASEKLNNREANKIKELADIARVVSTAMRFGHKVQKDGYFCAELMRELSKMAFRSRQDVLADKLVRKLVVTS